MFRIHYRTIFTFSQDENKYNSRIISLPSPEFYVLYNGEKNLPEESTLKLSDAFCENPFSNTFGLDLVVKVFNIKKDKNPKLLERSEVLNGYSTFVDNVETAKKQKIEKPIRYAIEKCINDGVYVDFFKQLSKEDREMIFTDEYDYDTDIKVKTKEAFEDGEMQAKLESAIAIIKKLNLPAEKAAEVIGISLEDLNKALENIN